MGSWCSEQVKQHVACGLCPHWMQMGARVLGREQATVLG